jgi:hypothetical protein
MPCFLDMTIDFNIWSRLILVDLVIQRLVLSWVNLFFGIYFSKIRLSKALLATDFNCRVIWIPYLCVFLYLFWFCFDLIITNISLYFILSLEHYFVCLNLFIKNFLHFLLIDLLRYEIISLPFFLPLVHPSLIDNILD